LTFPPTIRLYGPGRLPPSLLLQPLLQLRATGRTPVDDLDCPPNSGARTRRMRSRWTTINALITRRSEVQILPPPLEALVDALRGSLPGLHFIPFLQRTLRDPLTATLADHEVIRPPVDADRACARSMDDRVWSRHHRMARRCRLPDPRQCDQALSWLRHNAVVVAPLVGATKRRTWMTPWLPWTSI
jgi:hypothetical protein